MNEVKRLLDSHELGMKTSPFYDSQDDSREMQKKSKLPKKMRRYASPT